MDLDVVMNLRRVNYSWSKISSMMGISRSTLYRKLECAGIPTNDYTPLSKQQLDEIISSIKIEHPNDGEVLIQGHLIRLYKAYLARGVSGLKGGATGLRVGSAMTLLSTTCCNTVMSVIVSSAVRSIVAFVGLYKNHFT